MSNQRKQLISPNNLPIVGAKLIDGSLSDFDYLDRLITFPNGNSANLAKSQGELILVDTEGSEWPFTEV